MDELGVLPAKLAPKTAALDASGELRIGGCRVSELVEQFGSPLFVYDEEHLRTAMRAARNAFAGNVVYASKAFSGLYLARLVAEEGLWWDAASEGELEAALRGGIPAERVVLHGNNKSFDEIARALEVGVGRIVIDSFDEIALLAELASRPQRVWLRVTPGIEAHTHAYVRTGQRDSKFGFNLESGDALRGVARVRATPNLELVGLHCHIGSQIFALESFDEAVALMADLAWQVEVGEVSIGGGFGVPYVHAEDSPAIGEWARHVSEELERHAKGALRGFIEPGRAIVAQAAVTLYRVGVIKDVPGVRRYVAVDGGMSDNPRPVLYGSGYEAFVPTRLRTPHDVRMTVVGKHCESGDVLVHSALLPADLAVGDLLMTPVTGAYGYGMGSNYNRLPRPAVVAVRDGIVTLVARRERIDDLFRLEEEL